MMWIIPVLESSRSNLSKLMVWRERGKAVLERLWVFEPGSFKRFCYLYHKCIIICDCMVSFLSLSCEIIQCSTIPNRLYTSLPLSLSLSVWPLRESNKLEEKSLSFLSLIWQKMNHISSYESSSLLSFTLLLSLFSLSTDLSLSGNHSLSSLQYHSNLSFSLLFCCSCPLWWCYQRAVGCSLLLSLSVESHGKKVLSQRISLQPSQAIENLFRHNIYLYDVTILSFILVVDLFTV